MKCQFVLVNGVELAYEDLGAGSRPLVLVHGFTGFRDDFRDHLTALAGVGRTIVYDQRGHGESAHTGDPRTYTLDQLVDDLRAFLDTLGVEACDLLGHSMGGMVALRFVFAYPERVSSLVLMDTAARAPDGLARAPLAAGGAIAREEGMQTLATLLRHRAAADPTRPAASHRLEERMGAAAYWERHHRRVGAMDPEAFATLGVALVDQDPLTHRLGEIGCPTLVIVGEEDVPFLDPAREFAAAIREARLVTVAEAAHSPQLENPAVWREVVLDHLVRVRSLEG